MSNGRNYIFFCLITLLLSCSGGQQLDSKDGFAIIPAAKKGERIATFAGGCFWATQECMVELKGVHKVISGYSGGSKANPTYAEMLSKTTGHAEAVQVYYDPQLISFEQLTAAFFAAHDPTQLNRQGPDIGSDYRSIAFFRSADEYNTIRKLIRKIDSSGVYKEPVVTEVLPYEMIYGAEMDHQDYYKKNAWDPYIRNVSKLKVMKLRKEIPELIKNEYLN
jgi:peptide-methionine (S)-S-oxide reductase